MELNKLQESMSKLDSEGYNKLINFVNEKNLSLEVLSNLSLASEDEIKTLSNFFETKDEVLLDTKENESKNDLDFENIKILSRLSSSKKGNKESSNNKESKAKNSILKIYRNLDNLIENVESKETTINDVVQISEDTFGCYLTGTEIAKMYLSNTLVYDATMQRGIKVDKSGNSRASFTDKHVKEIYNSIVDGTFTATQIHLALITDDDDLQSSYDGNTGSLSIEGKIRLIDGQHRARALTKAFNELEMKKLEGVNLDDYIFNTVIHVCTADEARIIYSNINKNLKLDKSQVRQLSGDLYAKIVNMLNQSSDSDLKGKIATSKPVGDRLVLFSNLAESIEKVQPINSIAERNKVANYLVQFFNYVAEKLPEAFGNDKEARKKFRENNLLNENNFFLTWIKIAFLDTVNYKDNVDIIVNNVNYFNKNYVDENGEYIWVKGSAITHKANNKEGFAMNNKSAGINSMVVNTLNLLNDKRGEK